MASASRRHVVQKKGKERITARMLIAHTRTVAQSPHQASESAQRCVSVLGATVHYPPIREGGGH